MSSRESKMTVLNVDISVDLNGHDHMRYNKVVIIRPLCIDLGDARKIVLVLVGVVSRGQQKWINCLQRLWY